MGVFTLKSADHAVVDAGDGEDALRCATRKQANLALKDASIPIATGVPGAARGVPREDVTQTEQESVPASPAAMTGFVVASPPTGLGIDITNESIAGAYEPLGGLLRADAPVVLDGAAVTNIDRSMLQLRGAFAPAPECEYRPRKWAAAFPVLAREPNRGGVAERLDLSQRAAAAGSAWK